jgi:cyclopropane fatty-acyl-phospholipid synthase-like methyltransferase
MHWIKPLHEIYSILEPHLKPPGVAVELGCGIGHGLLFLLEKGYEVYGVDMSAHALGVLRERLPVGAKAHLVEADMSEWEVPPADVVAAGFSLFFLSQEKLEAFVPRMLQAIKPGGLFAGQFLGENDEWASRGHGLVDSNMLREIFRDFELIHFDEVQREGETTLKQAKFWHVFHVVARKPG